MVDSCLTIVKIKCPGEVKFCLFQSIASAVARAKPGYQEWQKYLEQKFEF